MISFYQSYGEFNLHRRFDFLAIHTAQDVTSRWLSLDPRLPQWATDPGLVFDRQVRLVRGPKSERHEHWPPIHVLKQWPSLAPVLSWATSILSTTNCRK